MDENESTIGTLFLLSFHRHMPKVTKIIVYVIDFIGVPSILLKAKNSNPIDLQNKLLNSY